MTDQIIESKREIIASLTDPAGEAKARERYVFQFLIKLWLYSTGPLIYIPQLLQLTNNFTLSNSQHRPISGTFADFLSSI